MARKEKWPQATRYMMLFMATHDSLHAALYGVSASLNGGDKIQTGLWHEIILPGLSFHSTQIKCQIFIGKNSWP